MIARRFCIYLLILLITINPVSAGDITLNRWVFNITIHDDGQVEEVIQAEIENGGSSPIDGISFIVPASGITIIDDFSHTFSSKGQTFEQKMVEGGTKVILSFNESIQAGQIWDGRIGFTADNWAIKTGSNYSLDIPVEAPFVIVSGIENKPVTRTDADIRGQVFLPRSVELISVTPEPFRELFQYDRIVPTWTPEKLHIGDVVRIKASFSNVLDKIVSVDEKARDLANRIKKAKAEGKDVSEAEAYLNNANEYNIDQALASFGRKNFDEALQYAGYANEELVKAQNSMPGETSQTVEPVKTPAEKKTPAFEAPFLIMILLIVISVSKKGHN